MPSPRDNMLEAFKDVSGKKNPVGGPFSGASGAASARAPGRRSGARGAVVVAAGLALAFVVGVAVGRATAGPDGTVQAAGSDSGEGYALGALTEDELGTTRSPWVEPAPPAAPVQGDEAALSDPRNKYTLVAISVTPKNEAIAWANYDHLIAQGLPAFRPFPAPNGMLTIVVGAAPKESDLAEVLSRLQRLPGPNGKGRPYDGAYAQPIRKLTAGSGD